jgi:hypothetical protein
MGPVFVGNSYRTVVGKDTWEEGWNIVEDSSSSSILVLHDMWGLVYLADQRDEIRLVHTAQIYFLLRANVLRSSSIRNNLSVVDEKWS